VLLIIVGNKKYGGGMDSKGTTFTNFFVKPGKLFENPQRGHRFKNSPVFSFWLGLYLPRKEAD
jgi:hypothetical protein